MRLGIPYATVGFVLSMSFGVVARQAGFSPLQAVATSAFVFAGSAQFAALAVVTGGGTLAAAIAAAKAAEAGRAEVRHYPCDHFDVWPGRDWFEPTVDDQLHFLRRHLAR